MKNRTNLFLTLSLFAVVSGLVASSFYMWYTQAEVPAVVGTSAEVGAPAPAVLSCATGVPAGAVGQTPANGAQFWTNLVDGTKNLWPRLVVFADCVYQYLVNLAYQTKFNLLWKYRHKQTVLGIVGVVVLWFLLFFLALFISYSLGKRRGKREAASDCCQHKKKR